MRILAIDVGTGTQDILLFDSDRNLENCVKLVMPSATSIVAARVREAARQREPLLLTGVTMGGGPSGWAVEEYVRAGGRVYATPEAARTFDDHLENVEALGIRVVSEDESAGLRGVRRVEMKDVDLEAVGAALHAFDVVPEYDGIAIAVFDHGAAPRDVSDRTFRFDYLRRVLEAHNELQAFGHLAADVPPFMTRMRSVVATLSPLAGLPLLLLDTAPAGALGSLGDSRLQGAGQRLLVNLGNMHATAFWLDGERVLGLFEHHTGLVNREKLDGLLRKLLDGSLRNAEVFEDHGHGAHLFGSAPERPVLSVTGPQRAMMQGSPLRPHFAVPHGDMMLAGCFGLLRAFAGRLPEWREAIETRLAAA